MAQQKEFLTIANELILARSFLDWRKNPKSSIRSIFKSNFNNYMKVDEKQTNSKEMLSFAIGCTTSNLLRQTFITTYEYLRNNIDDKMTERIKELKTENSSNKNNLNTAKFLDVIRQSFVHNDVKAEIPNWQIDEKFNIVINVKGNSFKFNMYELHILMTEFLSLKKDAFFINIDVREQNLFDAVKKDKLNPKTMKSLFGAKNMQNDHLLILDDYQQKALFDLFTNEQSLLGKQIRLNKLQDDNYYILVNGFPFKHNAGNIGRLNNVCFRNLFILDKNFNNKKTFFDAIMDFESTVYLVDDKTHFTTRQNLIEFMHYDTIMFEATLFSNILFSLFSSVHFDKITPYLSSFDIDARRLRNSIMHGRYYYNHNLGFEFYDGRDNDKLEHIASLNIYQISDIVSKFLNTDFYKTYMEEKSSSC